MSIHNQKQRAEEITRLVNKQIEQAYYDGQLDAYKQILFILQNKRDGLNVQRGGKHCSKPYLHDTNVEVELLDILITEVQNKNNVPLSKQSEGDIKY